MSNLIAEDDKILGSVKDIIGFIKEEIIMRVNRIDFDSSYIEANEIEDIQECSNALLEVLNALYQDYLTEIVTMNTEIKLFAHPMGNLMYEVIGNND